MDTIAKDVHLRIINTVLYLMLLIFVKERLRTMTEEYRNALRDLEIARINFNEATGAFVAAAIYDLGAAERRVMAILKEVGHE